MHYRDDDNSLNHDDDALNDYYEILYHDGGDEFLFLNTFIYLIIFHDYYGYENVHLCIFIPIVIFLFIFVLMDSHSEFFSL